MTDEQRLTALSWRKYFCVGIGHDAQGWRVCLETGGESFKGATLRAAIDEMITALSESPHSSGSSEPTAENPATDQEGRGECQ
jgi:hypothetical protein